MDGYAIDALSALGAWGIVSALGALRVLVDFVNLSAIGGALMPQVP